MLAWLGDRIDKGRVPFVARLHKGGGGGVWSWVVDRVLRRPVVSVVLAGGLLVALTIPAFGLHTVDTGVQGLPPDLAVTKTLKRIQAAFPGGAVPAQVVVQANDVNSPAVAAGIDQIELGALGTGRMRQPIEVTVNPRHDTAIVSIPLDGSGTDATSIAALHSLRDTVIPNTIAKVPGTTTHVGGPTAGSVDFNEQMKSRAPYVFAFVLGLAFLLLMVTFRSIVIPLKAIVLNLLSVGAAYGVLVLIFQDGRFESALGFKSIGGITSWLPLFLFVILFGLSMDYHVLILTRVREAFDRGMTTDKAVASGIKATAGVVTSAAAVMVAVFAIFATLSSLDFKMMGVGLATAVLIDATLVRAVLLPASMKLLGDWNWYLPRWLDWLPEVAHEEAPAEAPAAGFEIKVGEEPDRIRVTLRGELDADDAAYLGARLRELEESSPKLIVVDVREVEFADPAGVGQLYLASRRARDTHRRFVVVEDGSRLEQAADGRPEDAIETAADPATV
jgi:RND superfamily putative drug exporter